MKKNGFTLVELLAVIAILGIIALIAVVSVSSTLKESKKSLSETQIKQIEKAAEAYYLKEGMNTEKTCIPVSYLLDNGYLDGKTIIDPKTKNEINGYVKISYSSNQYNYKYQEACLPCSLKDTDIDGIADVGEVVTCNFEKGIEKFYVLEETNLSKQTINLLPEKNITVSGDAVQSDDAGYLVFSPSNYSTCLNGVNNNSTYYEETYHFPYWVQKDTSTNYCEELSTPVLKKYVDNNNFVYDENSNLYSRVNLYKEYLSFNGLTNVNATLLNKEQMDNFCKYEPNGCINKNAPEWIYSTDYFIGSIDYNYLNSFYQTHTILMVFSYGGYIDASWDTPSGIRPVITIGTENLK